MNILTINLALSTLVFWIAAKLYVLPKLQDYEARTILLPILLLHSLRHLGLMFLTSGATYPGIPPQFTHPAAYGDLITAVLAMIGLRGSAVYGPRILDSGVLGAHRARVATAGMGTVIGKVERCPLL